MAWYMAEKVLNIPCTPSPPVKPAAVSNLHLVHNGTLVHVEWAPPSGPIPEQCLEYELEITTGNHNVSKKQVSLTHATRGHHHCPVI